MPSVEFRPATDYSLQLLAELFTASFEDYVVPLQMSPEALTGMAAADDLRFRLTQVMLVDGDVAGIGGVAVRDTRARMAFFGIIKARRRQGLGQQLCARLQEVVEEAKLSTMVLEVIQSNVAAEALYQHMGFVRQRELVFWERKATGVGPLPEQAELVSAASVLSLVERLPTVPRAWQNDLLSLGHRLGVLRGLVLRGADGNPTGYAIFREGIEARGVVDAVADGASAPLLIEALAATGRSLSFPNFPGDDPLTLRLPEFGFERTIAQWEMRWDPGGQ